MPEPEASKTIQLTKSLSVTLAAPTRTHLRKAIAKYRDYAEQSVKSKCPTPPQGYTHEQALEAWPQEYGLDWLKYQAEIQNIQVYLTFGTAWEVGGLDQEESEYEAERAGAIARGLRLGLSKPAPTTPEMGALLYALIEMLKGAAEVQTIFDWLLEGAGLINSAAVAEERKSAPDNGEQPPAGGSGGGDKETGEGRE